jgi:hypothetical protein
MKPFRSSPALWLSVIVAVCLLLLPATALANALVVVRVRGPEGTPEGRVVLKSRDGGREFSCQTHELTCRIDHVPGGRYSVHFEPRGGRGTRPKPAMIPPEGTATLFVSAVSGR